MIKEAGGIVNDIDKFDIKKLMGEVLQDTEQNLFLDLKKNVTHLKKNLSRNWRHNFYRSKKNILKTTLLTGFRI